MSNPANQITQLLARVGEGDESALDELAPLVYAELRALASRFMRDQPAAGTMCTTALVHEAYVKLVDQTRVQWEGRAHFFGVAAKAMRSILVDQARRRGAAKRGGDANRIPFDEALARLNERNVDVLALEEALQRFSRLDERKARVVELRFFGNLTNEEAAEVIGVSTATVERDWRMAKAWLHRELSRGDSRALVDER